MNDFDALSQRADEIGLRLEIINGLPVREVHPNLTHQEAIDRIRRTITSAPGRNGQHWDCLHYADLHIRFPDGSDKRPDISIFSQRPSESESAVTDVPEAVIEIVSRGYEAKDLEISPPFYLSQGVRDVIVFDPYTRRILHFDPSGAHEYQPPFTLTLRCGCQVTV